MRHFSIRTQPPARFELRRGIDPQIDALRRGANGLDHGARSAVDAFDARALHLVAKVDGELVGALRIHQDGRPVLRAWTDGRFPPEGLPRVMAVTRLVVADAGQQRDIPAGLLSTATELADGRGAWLAALVHPDAAELGDILNAGFIVVGAPVHISHARAGASAMRATLLRPPRSSWRAA